MLAHLHARHIKGACRRLRDPSFRKLRTPHLGITNVRAYLLSRFLGVTFPHIKCLSRCTCRKIKGRENRDTVQSNTCITSCDHSRLRLLPNGDITFKIEEPKPRIKAGVRKQRLLRVLSLDQAHQPRGQVRNRKCRIDISHGRRDRTGSERAYRLKRDRKWNHYTASPHQMSFRGKGHSFRYSMPIEC